jgi:dolichyl-phosphate-mannose--protein O-mannosyl transferase
MTSKAKSAARRLERMKNAKGRLSLLPSLGLLFIAGTRMSNLVRHDQQVRRNYHHHKAEASALSLSLSLSLSPIWLGLFKTEKEENHKKTPKKKKPNQI